MIKTKIFGLGGMQEIGKAAIVIEHGEEMVIIDSGIKFADSWQTGIQGIIPDYTYLKANQHKIKAIFITHGHEDHIGAIPYLLQEVHIPKIYASRIGCEYIKAKLQERKIKHNTEFIETTKDLVVKYDQLTVDFWTVQHSIPDAFGVRVKTPNGTVADTGDFRIDYTPIGAHTDFDKLDKVGEEGLTLLFSDSTNAMRPDHSPTEQGILEDIQKIIEKAENRILFTTFASNIERVGAVIEMVEKMGKKVCPFGRSMVNGIKIASRAGYIKIKPNTIIDKKQISKYDKNEVVILTTGSQGEEMAALSRMARGQHHQVKVEKDDLIIFSSSPIPGNRMKIELLINQLTKLGADIKENGIDGRLHTSGHAYKDEHRTVFRKAKPKYFTPFHGEYRMSVAHAQTAVECGVKEENIFIIDNGQVLEMVDEKITLSEEFINPGPIYIDGITASKQTNEVIAERERLADSGFVNVVVAIDKKKNSIIGRPRLISRGTLFVKSSQELMNEAQRLVHGSTLYTIKNKKDWKVEDVKSIIKERLEPLFYKVKRRRPIIIPVIIFAEGKKQNGNKRGKKPSNNKKPNNNNNKKQVTKKTQNKQTPKPKTTQNK
ncbi:ribonuclease J [Mycoplasma marinum]|uniref:Ribonuclease J n=1 Tax=Mycoplasma marinum TaxID=1937190 RepID=A0A4R0XSK1_9MOLU|nr:ribonuclease J [Mycoplasma marinum]TCG10687.1 RNase J family beta-CASP ribonuclease [Mycoplasma marinum]